MSGDGAKRTSRAGLMMSVDRGNPEVAAYRQTDAIDPKADIRRDFTVIIPAIEPKPNPATPKPGSADAMTAATLPIDGSYGLAVDQ